MTKGEERIRLAGDLILRKMTAFTNYGTGRPEFIPKKEWEAVTSKSEMKHYQVVLWNQLKEVDPMRAERVKPQNPYVK